MKCIKGRILTDQGLKKGYLHIKNKTTSISLGTSSKPADQKGIIVPTFVNAHTHIGDTFIRKKQIPLPQNIEQLVAPPDGLKHILLTKTDNQEIMLGIKDGLDELQKAGISTFVDFRENGLTGVMLLKKQLDQKQIQSIILSRPDTHHPSSREITHLLAESSGIGISSVEDWDYNEVALIVHKTKKLQKLFALHVSERIREPIEPIVQLHPDFIIHMTQASKEDLELVKDQHIPIVVCPRSNYFFHMKPNLELMKKVGNILLLGTDNFMFHNPSIIDEIRCIQTHFPSLFTLEELLKMPTYNARKALNLKDNIPGSTFPSSWIVLNPINYHIETIIKKVEEG
jgi:cytosine/adenosine deaminase-related metal-dependent hydrolase